MFTVVHKFEINKQLSENSKKLICTKVVEIPGIFYEPTIQYEEPITVIVYKLAGMAATAPAIRLSIKENKETTKFELVFKPHHSVIRFLYLCLCFCCVAEMYVIINFLKEAEYSLIYYFEEGGIRFVASILVPILFFIAALVLYLLNYYANVLIWKKKYKNEIYKIICSQDK